MRRAVIGALLRAEAHGAAPYTDNDVIYTTGPRLLTDAALETIACDTGLAQTFGWLDVSGLDAPSSFGSVHVLPLFAFSGDPMDAAEDEGLRKLMRVEHFYSGARGGRRDRADDGAGGWKHRSSW